MKKAKLNIKSMKLTDLLDARADYNPRVINSEQKAGLRHSMDKFGYVSNVVLNETTGNIVSGHQRLDILKEQGYDEVDVHIIKVSLDDEKKLNILMNAKTITGDFTSGINEMLDEILDYDSELFDLAGLKFLYEDDNEDEDDGKSKSIEGVTETKDEIEGMRLLPYESYDAVLVVFKRRDDFMFVSTKLGLGDKVGISSPSVKNKKLGYTRAVDGAELVKLINNNDEKEEDIKFGEDI